MSDALRPSSLFTSAAPATAPSGVLATLQNPPPEVSQLATGTTLRGTVVGHDDHGHLLVRTDLGTLAVSTKANPPPGSEVVLQIRSSGAQLHVLLMHSDIAAGGGAPRGAPAALPGGGGAIPDRLTLGHNIRAIVQAPAPPGGAGALEPALAAALARLAPGSAIVLRITAVDVPAGPPGAPSGPSPLAATPTGSASGTAPVAPVPAGGPAAAAAGQPVTPLAPKASGPGAAPVPGSAPAGGTPAGTPDMAGQRMSAPQPPAGAGGPTPAQPSLAQGPAPAPGTSASSPGPATTAALPGSSPAPAIPAPSVPPAAGHAISANVRSAATAAGAAYGAAGQQHAGPLSPAAAPGGSVAPHSSHPVSVPTAATANVPVAPPLVPAAAGADPAAPRLTGVVTATTNAGHPVLQTPIGTLTLEVRAALPVGSRVIFELLPESLPRGAAGLPFDSEALPSSLARAWPAVEEAVRVLHDSALPGANGGPGTPAIPQPGPRLASALLFLLAALSGGDVNRWLGERGAQALKDAGRGGLLARLGQDFGQLSRPVESGGGDWRLFLIPMLDGNQVQQIRFFERHGAPKRGGRGDGPDGDLTRFILEVELSKLGDMQLDGLVRERRFDLMLRTRRPLPEAMRYKITDIFNEANETSGYIGSIGFQASREWRLMPVAGDIAAAAGAGLVI